MPLYLISLIVNLSQALPTSSRFVDHSRKKQTTYICLEATTTDGCCHVKLKSSEFDTYFLSLTNFVVTGDVVMQLRPVQSINTICGIVDWKGGRNSVYNGRHGCQFDCEDIRTVDKIEENKEYLAQLHTLLERLGRGFRYLGAIKITKNVRLLKELTMVCPLGHKARVEEYPNLRVDGPDVGKMRNVAICYEDENIEGIVRASKRAKMEKLEFLCMDSDSRMELSRAASAIAVAEITPRLGQHIREDPGSRGV